MVRIILDISQFGNMGSSAERSVNMWKKKAKSKEKLKERKRKDPFPPKSPESPDNQFTGIIT